MTACASVDVITKAAAETIVVCISFESLIIWPGEMIEQVQWATDQGIEIVNDEQQGTEVYALVSGGQPGHVYRLAATVTTSTSQYDQRWVRIAVTECGGDAQGDQ